MATDGTDARAFDQNDVKYKVFCRLLHVRFAARIVSVFLVLAIVFNLIFSMNKSSTVVLYSWVTAAFSIGVYGSLLYAVFKEKKMFCLPFIFVQAAVVALTVLFFFSFLIAVASSASMVRHLQTDFWDNGASANLSEKQKHAEEKEFVTAVILGNLVFIALEAWVLHVIYRFYIFLQDREISFNFSLDTEFQMTS
ncbi:hypothetical protein QR680_005481 [Steinernema hermaphroditum]|uniref:Uncharacterized protein n=1 Tax=Steinernema hermaphroditum TaxID=289476 RepID=A0AA39HS69_9BILA|nr:hypothetical protein QR680_005481 [Steinernema hermaphroditum]